MLPGIFARFNNSIKLLYIYNDHIFFSPKPTTNMKSILKVIVISCIIVFTSCNNKAAKENPVTAKDTAVPAVEYLTIQQQDEILNAIKKDTSTDISLGTGKVISTGQGGEGYYLTRRTVTGYVEMHEQWDDVAVIRSGHAILKTGTKVKGEQQSSGEKPLRNWHGGEIEDAAEKTLSPGDFIVIPAMTAHQYIPAKGDTLVYWTIKIKRVHE